MKLENICRLCLGQCKDESKSVFAANDEIASNYHTFLMSFTHLKINQNDGLPDKLCPRCIAQILNVHSFRKQCESADLSLRQYMTKTDIHSDIDLITLFTRVDSANDQATSNDGSAQSTCKKIIKIEGTIILRKPSNSQNFKTETKEEITTSMEVDEADSEFEYEDVILNKLDDDFESALKETYSDGKMMIVEQKDSKELFVCKKCGKINETFNELNEHLKVHNPDKPFRCKFGNCHWSFATEEECDIHVKANHLSKRDNGYECLFCLKIFNKLKNLRSHITQHKEIKKLSCQYCNRAFNLRHHLIQHERTHTGELPFICDTCGRGFISKYNLVVHLRRHTGIRPYSCKECNKTFVTPGEHRIHMTIHTGEIVICAVCGLCFKSQYKLNHHNRIKHSEDRRPPKKASTIQKNRLSTCNVCGFFAGSLQQLDQHMKEHTCQYNCSLCSKSFPLMSALETHIKSHSSQKKSHPCTTCGVSYKRSTHLQLHILRKHNTSAKLYKCDRCPLSFAQSCELTAHNNYHNGIRPYRCKECDKSFGSSSRLRIHTRIHTGEQPYCCGVCQKSFISNAYLKIHMRTHSKKLTDIPLIFEDNGASSSTFIVETIIPEMDMDSK